MLGTGSPLRPNTPKLGVLSTLSLTRAVRAALRSTGCAVAGTGRCGRPGHVLCGPCKQQRLCSTVLLRLRDPLPRVCLLCGAAPLRLRQRRLQGCLRGHGGCVRPTAQPRRAVQLHRPRHEPVHQLCRPAAHRCAAYHAGTDGDPDAVCERAGSAAGPLERWRGNLARVYGRFTLVDG